MSDSLDNVDLSNSAFLSQKPKRKVRKLKNLRNLSDHVVIVEVDGRHLFAIIKEGSVELRDSYEVEELDEGGLRIVKYIIDESLIPPLTFPVVEAPREAEELGDGGVIEVVKAYEAKVAGVNEEELYGEVVDFLKGHVWFPDERIYYVLASWILATYLAHLFPVYTYLLFIGPYGSGKSRALECLKALAFNALMVSSVSAAAVPALIEGWRATLLVDEAQLMNRDDRAELVAVLNEGYRKDGVYARATKDGYGVRAMKVGGFKAMAVPEEVARSLHARVIEVSMIELPPGLKDKYRMTVDEGRARGLRSKLLSFMVKHFHDPIDCEEIARELHSGGVTDRRLVEISVPLWYATPEPYKEELLNFLRDLSKRREEEKAASQDADLVGALMELRHEVRNGKLLLKRITEAFNLKLGLDEGRGFRPQTVGRLIKKLGLRKIRTHEGVCVVYDERLIAELALRYGLELPEEWRNYRLNLVRESNQEVSGVKCEEGEDLGGQVPRPKSPSACKPAGEGLAGDHAEGRPSADTCSPGSSQGSHFTQRKKEVENSNLTLGSQVLLLKRFIGLNQPVSREKLDRFLRSHGIEVEALKEAVRAGLVREDSKRRWWVNEG